MRFILIMSYRNDLHILQYGDNEPNAESGNSESAKAQQTGAGRKRMNRERMDFGRLWQQSEKITFATANLSLQIPAALLGLTF